MQGTIECELPNASLYTFTGNLRLEHPGQGPAEQATLPLSQASVLLRGCSLRNTQSILGAVIFAGHESKVRWIWGLHLLGGCKWMLESGANWASQHAAVRAACAICSSFWGPSKAVPPRCAGCGGLRGICRHQIPALPGQVLSNLLPAGMCLV